MRIYMLLTACVCCIGKVKERNAFIYTDPVYVDSN